MALEQLSNNLRTVGKFELSLAAFIGNSFDVSGQEASPTGFAFSSDGTRMFVVGSTDSVHQYSLTTGFDVSTASFSGTSFDVSGELSGAQDVAFSSDGTQMFVIDVSNDSVFQYSLTTRFDVSTASFSGTSFDVSGQETSPRGVAFSSDGTQMFVVGPNSDSVHQYSLTTGFDVSTASFSGTSFNVSGQDTSSRGVAFNSDGTQMFVVGGSKSVHQYSLTTGFDVSTASFSGTSFDVSAQDGNPQDVAFSSDGGRMFMIGPNSQSVFGYLIGRLTLQE